MENDGIVSLKSKQKSEKDSKKRWALVTVFGIFFGLCLTFTFIMMFNRRWAAEKFDSNGGGILQRQCLLNNSWLEADWSLCKYQRSTVIERLETVKWMSTICIVISLLTLFGSLYWLVRFRCLPVMQTFIFVNLCLNVVIMQTIFLVLSYVPITFPTKPFLIAFQFCYLASYGWIASLVFSLLALFKSPQHCWCQKSFIVFYVILAYGSAAIVTTGYAVRHWQNYSQSLHMRKTSNFLLILILGFAFHLFLAIAINSGIFKGPVYWIARFVFSLLHLRQGILVFAVMVRISQQTSKHTWLHLAILFGGLAYFYTRYHNSKARETYSIEMAVWDAWSKVIEHPPIQFRRMVIGINTNVDIVVSGTQLLSRLNATPNANVADHDVIGSLEDLQDTFVYHFAYGAPAERYTSDAKLFDTALHVVEREINREYTIGGNAANMAQKIASTYTHCTVMLVGPIGPRAKALLHPSIYTHNSTRISKDEMHIIMEYKQGEIWGEAVAPSSSRFITSHDVFSGSSVVMDMFFNAIASYKPDLVILSGVHLLENQPADLWQEKLRQLKRSLGQINLKLPIHLELGSIADSNFVKNVLHRIIPYVDSLGLNEQELAFLSRIAGGPYNDLSPRAGSIHVYKAVEILNWLLTNFGPDPKEEDPHSKKANYRLQRIHFHCLTFHLIAVRGPDWSNMAASVAAGARVAGRVACNSQTLDSSMVELRMGDNFLLDKEQGRVYKFQPHSPIVSWMREDVVFIYSPVLVCKSPIRTVGLGDTISSVGLVYSQFYRFRPKSRTT